MHRLPGSALRRGLYLGWALVPALGLSAACGPLRPPVNPGIRVAQRHGAVAVLEALEKLIEAGRDREVDREVALELVREMEDEGGPAYPYARAALAGRVAEKNALTAMGLLQEMQKYAKLSIDRDRDFMAGASRRMLGTLYVFVGDRLDGVDSEIGLELLEELVDEDPDNAVSRLRLAEGYVALGDPEGAFEHLCAARERRGELLGWEEALLAGLIDEAGGMGALGCEGEP